MIDFQNISKSYFGKYVLHQVSFRVNSGERVGLIGPNGAGKSTIFGIITGEVVPDSGSVAIPKDHRLGVMRQYVEPSALERPLLEYTADAIPELPKYLAELEELEKKLASGALEPREQESILRRHGQLQTAVEHLGAYSLDVDAKQALTSLGFPVESFPRKLKEFSGGWQMRATLARVLISRPDTLLLDEPSNYLDIPAIEWLCRFLANYAGTLLLISHDRFLLRKLTSTTLELNAGSVTRYAGNYDYYCRERENRQRTLEAAKRNTDRKREQMERVIDRFRAKSTKAAQAKSWQKKLDQIEEIDLPDALDYKGIIRFPEPPPAGVEAFRLEGLTFGYTPEKILFHDVDLEINSGDKSAIIGYNGLGKTTLLKLLVGKLLPTRGKVVIGHHAVIGYQAQEFSEILNDAMSAYDAVRNALPAGASTADLYNVLGSFGFSGDAVSKPCGVLSGGERIRLQLARIFVNPPNVLILDEPTTHLDIAARELLQEAIKKYPGTVCMVSHDIDFVRNTATTILALENGTITKYYGNYDYFLEKSSHAAGPSGTPQTSPHSTTGSAAAGASATGEAPVLAKDRRRARAQARQAISADLKRARETVEKLEKQLDEQSEQRKVLIAKLSSGMKLDFGKLKKQLAETEQAIHQTEDAWETAAAELESLRLENARIHED